MRNAKGAKRPYKPTQKLNKEPSDEQAEMAYAEKRALLALLLPLQLVDLQAQRRRGEHRHLQSIPGLRRQAVHSRRL